MPVHVQGRDPKVKEVRCSGCGVVLEYEPEDVYTYRHDLDPETGYIQCPRLSCEKYTKVPYPEGK